MQYLCIYIKTGRFKAEPSKDNATIFDKLVGRGWEAVSSTDRSEILGKNIATTTTQHKKTFLKVLI